MAALVDDIDAKARTIMTGGNERAARLLRAVQR